MQNNLEYAQAPIAFVEVPCVTGRVEAISNGPRLREEATSGLHDYC